MARDDGELEPRVDLREVLEDPAVLELLRHRARALLGRGGVRRSHESLSLVNRAIVRVLNERDDRRFPHRDAVLAYLVKALRSALLDEVRSTATLRRGAGRHSGPGAEMEADLLPAEGGEHGVRAFFDILLLLRARRPRAARIVELRFLFDGTWEEVAIELNITVGAAREEWEFARAWLARELRPPSP